MNDEEPITPEPPEPLAPVPPAPEQEQEPSAPEPPVNFGEQMAERSRAPSQNIGSVDPVAETTND